MPSTRSLGRRFGGSRRTPLPSLYDLHPSASIASRHARGLQVVALDQVVGTVRHPTQNTADFLPLPQLRGRNWMARWQRIRQAMDRMVTLPPVDLVQVGEDYFVADGHNRVAAARAAGAVAVDADVTELVLPGTSSPARPHHPDASTLLVGSDELKQAASGRQSRTAEHRLSVDELRRSQLLDTEEAPPGEPEPES